MQYLCVLIAINLASYIATIYLSKELSVENYSQLILVLTVSSLISTISLLGRSELMLRRISQSDYLVPITAIISSIGLSLIIFSTYILLYTPSSMYSLLLISLTLISIIVSFSSSMLKFKSKTIQLAITQKVNNIYKLMVAIVCFFGVASYQEKSLFIIILLYIVFFIYHFLFSCQSNYQFSKSKISLYDKDGLPFLVDGVVFLFYYQASIFVFGYYGMGYELALFSLALLPISAYSLVFNAYFSSLTQAKFYRLASKSNIEAIKYLNKILKYQVYIVPILIVSYFILLEWIIPRVFDLNKYPDLVRIMTFIFPMILLKFFSSSLSIYMNLKENIKIKNFICIVAGIVGLFMSLLFINVWGLNGAVITTLFVELIIFIGFFVNLRYMTRGR